MFYPAILLLVLLPILHPMPVGETKTPNAYKKTVQTVAVKSTNPPASAVKYTSQSTEDLRGTSVSQTKSEQGVSLNLTPVDSTNVIPTSMSASEPAPIQPSFDKYDGDCSAHPTAGRCADKCADPSDILVGYDPTTSAAICKPQPQEQN